MVSEAHDALSADKMQERFVKNTGISELLSFFNNLCHGEASRALSSSMALLCLLLQLLYQRVSGLGQKASKVGREQLTARQSELLKITKQSVAQGGI